MIRKRQALKALRVIAATACENYTNGPGACLRWNYLPQYPTVNGTFEECCYPCIAWAVLNGVPLPAKATPIHAPGAAL